MPYPVLCTTVGMTDMNLIRIKGSRLPLSIEPITLSSRRLARPDKVSLDRSAGRNLIFFNDLYSFSKRKSTMNNCDIPLVIQPWL
jgi:hypothetical protein